MLWILPRSWKYKLICLSCVQKVFMHISEAMRTRILLLFLLFTTTADAQVIEKFRGVVSPMEDFVGTWQYASNDTVFTVKFVEGREINPYIKNDTRRYLYGGYALEVGGVLVEDYLNVHSVLDVRIAYSEQHIYIVASISCFPTSFLVCYFMISVRSILMGMVFPDVI